LDGQRHRIGATIDRIEDLSTDYADAGGAATRVKLSAELRLCDASLARLLKLIKTDVPAAESLTTVKARRAVNVRWDRQRNAGA
jgi:hypothetical protein